MKVMRTLFSSIIVLAVSLSALSANAEIVVVVNPASSLDKLSDEDIGRLFLGKIKTFPNGKSATALNQNTDTTARGEFDSGVLGKSSQQLKSYWSQLIFSGKGKPPKEVGGDADMLKAVAADPQAIGYDSSSAVDSSVKVVFKK